MGTGPPRGLGGFDQHGHIRRKFGRIGQAEFHCLADMGDFFDANIVERNGKTGVRLHVKVGQFRDRQQRRSFNPGALIRNQSQSRW